jgi:hypothetical protein
MLVISLKKTELAIVRVGAHLFDAVSSNNPIPVRFVQVRQHQSTVPCTHSLFTLLIHPSFELRQGRVLTAQFPEGFILPGLEFPFAPGIQLRLRIHPQPYWTSERKLLGFLLFLY